MKIYSSNPIEMIKSFFRNWIVLTFLFCALAAVAIGILKISLLPVPIHNFILCAVIAIPISVLIIIFHGSISVQVDENRVAFFRRDKIYAEYSRASHAFSSYVHVTRIYLVPVTTEKFLTILDGKSKPKRRKCHNFSGKDFEEMISQIGQLDVKNRLAEREESAQKNHKTDVDGDDSSGLSLNASVELDGTPVSHQGNRSTSNTFSVPRDSILTTYRKRITGTLILVASLLVVLIGFFVHSLLNSPRSSTELMISLIFIGGLLLILALVYYLALVRPYLKMKKSMPSRIAITENGIHFDERNIPFSDIQQIRATPPTYTIAKNNSALRRVTVFIKDGGKKTYFFGFPGSVRNTKVTFAEYAELCEALGETLISREKDFLWELV